MRQLGARFQAVIFVGALLAPALASAAEIPLAIRQSTVQVICGNRQGSGVITNASEGYVLTNGHVAINIETGVAESECEIGFIIDDSLRPKSFYNASVVHAVYSSRQERDYAVLQIGRRHLGGPATKPTLAELPANEFSTVGDTLTVYGFVGNAPLTRSDGFINSFSRGLLQSGAVIAPGDSGGPAVDANNHLVGLATRSVFQDDPDTGQRTFIHYEMGDILPLEVWLDTLGPGEHDRIVVHADPQRIHSAPFVIRQEGLGCQYLVRTTISKTVYCLLLENKRLVFPNESSYFTWFPDFRDVLLASIEDVSKYLLVGNVTQKAGTLVKIATDPKVYLVTDSIGTIRWVQTEERARELFGFDWASQIKDVSDAFFVDYTVGLPID